MSGNLKNIMYRCDHCPKETDTCVKLAYDTHTECVDPCDEPKELMEV